MDGTCIQGILPVANAQETGRLLKGRVSERSSDVKTLETQRKQMIATIWTCQSLDELQALVEKL